MVLKNYTKYSNGLIECGHYASQSNIRAMILIRRCFIPSSMGGAGGAVSKARGHCGLACVRQWGRLA